LDYKNLFSPRQDSGSLRGHKYTVVKRLFQQ